MKKGNKGYYKNYDSSGKKSKKVYIVVILAAVVGAAAYFSNAAYNYYQQEKLAKEARRIYEESLVSQTPPPTMPPVVSPETPSPDPTPTPEPTPTPAPTPRPLNPQLAALREFYKNDEIIGYLNIYGTSIDYPVTQGRDNNYYLSHDIEKKESVAGWIYLDYENDVSLENRHMIIYGHNMKSDYMFHSIRYYSGKDYYNKHKYIVFNTVYENYIWEVFAFFRTTTEFYYLDVFFRNDAAFLNLVDGMKERAAYDTGIEITAEDRVLTLSTCTGEGDYRYVVCARLVTNLDEVPDEVLEQYGIER